MRNLPVDHVFVVLVSCSLCVLIYTRTFLFEAELLDRDFGGRLQYFGVDSWREGAGQHLLHFLGLLKHLYLLLLLFTVIL